MVLYMLRSTMKDEVFQWTNPCYHSTCYCTWYCNLYFSADHAQETIHGLLQAFSSSRFQASDQRKCREKTANNEACSYYAREKVCETDLDQTYKGLQGEGVVDPGSVK